MGHIMPGELLAFIAVAPYLKEGSVVVFHDTHLPFLEGAPGCIAPNVAVSCICGEKISCYDKGFPGGFANISAIIINNDTMKYIDNCFHALSLPWMHELYHDAAGLYIKLFTKRYSSEQVLYFKNAINANRNYLMSSIK